MTGANDNNVVLRAKIEWYREILQLEPNSKIFLPFARHLAEVGSSENNPQLLNEAFDVLRRGLELHPDFMEARLFLIELLNACDCKSQCGAEVARLASLFLSYPDFWDAWREYAISENESGDFAVALGFMGAILKDKSVSIVQVLEAGLASLRISPNSMSGNMPGNIYGISGTGSSTTRTPDISMPDISTPDISTPDISMSDISTPDMCISDVSMSGLEQLSENLTEPHSCEENACEENFFGNPLSKDSIEPVSVPAQDEDSSCTSHEKTEFQCPVSFNTDRLAECLPECVAESSLECPIERSAVVANAVLESALLDENIALNKEGVNLGSIADIAGIEGIEAPLSIENTFDDVAIDLVNDDVLQSEIPLEVLPDKPQVQALFEDLENEFSLDTTTADIAVPDTIDPITSKLDGEILLENSSVESGISSDILDDIKAETSESAPLPDTFSPESVVEEDARFIEEHIANYQNFAKKHEEASQSAKEALSALLADSSIVVQPMDKTVFKTRSMADVLAEQDDFLGAIEIYQELLAKADDLERPILEERLQDLQNLAGIEPIDTSGLLAIDDLVDTSFGLLAEEENTNQSGIEQSFDKNAFESSTNSTMSPVASLASLTSFDEQVDFESNAEEIVEDIAEEIAEDTTFFAVQEELTPLKPLENLVVPREEAHKEFHEETHEELHEKTPEKMPEELSEEDEEPIAEFLTHSEISTPESHMPADFTTSDIDKAQDIPGMTTRNATVDISDTMDFADKNTKESAWEESAPNSFEAIEVDAMEETVEEVVTEVVTQEISFGKMELEPLKDIPPLIPTESVNDGLDVSEQEMIFEPLGKSSAFNNSVNLVTSTEEAEKEIEKEIEEEREEEHVDVLTQEKQELSEELEGVLSKFAKIEREARHDLQTNAQSANSRRSGKIPSFDTPLDVTKKSLASDRQTNMSAEKSVEMPVETFAEMPADLQIDALQEENNAVEDFSQEIVSEISLVSEPDILTEAGSGSIPSGAMHSGSELSGSISSENVFSEPAPSEFSEPASSERISSGAVSLEVTETTHTANATKDTENVVNLLSKLAERLEAKGSV